MCDSARKGGKGGMLGGVWIGDAEKKKDRREKKRRGIITRRRRRCLTIRLCSSLTDCQWRCDAV